MLGPEVAGFTGTVCAVRVQEASGAVKSNAKSGVRARFTVSA